MRRTANGYSSGAVSIFIVIFSALLITTIVVGFIRLMIQEQRLASDADLSQSALNSAQAGVEDAKRALIRYQTYCLGSPAAAASEECVRLAAALNDGTQCNTMQRARIAGSIDDSEVMVRSDGNADDLQLQQAYTCVKIQLNTSDYIGQFSTNGSRMIPLRGTDDYDRVEIEWFSQSDLREANGDSDTRHQINLAGSARVFELPRLSDWSPNRPALLRTQLIQYGNNFQLNDFDAHDDGQSNARTLFLYPGIAGAPSINFASDARQNSTSGALQAVACDDDFATDTTDRVYACKATILLPNAIGQSDLKRTAYLRLDSLYNDHTSFRVQLKKGDADVVKFSSVQPIVDSTGRANDLFRRVQSRVEIDNSTFPFPQTAVSLAGDLCKTFLVTDSTAEYRSSADLCEN